MNSIAQILQHSHQADVRRITAIVSRINTLESTIQSLSDDDLRWQTVKFRQRLDGGETLEYLLPEAFATVREAARRTTGMRHFDEQVVGGLVVHEGKFAEIATGEGKTLTITLPAYVNALSGKGVHIVAPNEYLAQRDRNWMAPIYEALGMSASVLLNSQQMFSRPRKIAYATDVTYGTATEFGFDYLHDHTVPDLKYVMQRPLHFAIIDDIDYVLIDEARVPLSVAKDLPNPTELYQQFSRLVETLAVDEDFIVDVPSGSVHITSIGLAKIERQLGIPNLYELEELPRHLESALKAHALLQNGKDYVVRNGKVILIDSVTGRLLERQRFSEGLHQALEAKEGVVILSETQVTATITFQNYFLLYNKLAGLSATLQTDALEYKSIYNKDVVPISSRLPVRRQDHPDLIYLTKQGKLLGVVQEVANSQEIGQPVLVGTPSIEASEELSTQLDQRGIQHVVLNAKHHDKESQIIAQAGRPGAVTIISNMAGRGTDILLGGDPMGLVPDILREHGINPDFAPEDDILAARQEAAERCKTDCERALQVGGLYVIGTEHHSERRMDRQLRGRTGRQGDVGETRFFVSIEDDLMRRFNADRVAGVMSSIGMDDGMPIEGRLITQMIEQAQIKVEGTTCDWRAWVKSFDDELAVQRHFIYQDRMAILSSENVHDRILDIIARVAERKVREYVSNTQEDRADFEAIKKWMNSWSITVPTDLVQGVATQHTREQLITSIAKAARSKYEDKEKEVNTAAEQHHALETGWTYMRQFERAVLLQALDDQWQSHLDQLELLRTGINLRRLAQRDPLAEYRREAFAAFERFKSDVERDVAELAMRAPVQITLPNPESTNSRVDNAPLGSAAHRPREALSFEQPDIRPMWLTTVVTSLSLVGIDSGGSDA